MALAYLNEGATSLAAANWSDATGFAANATLVISSAGSQQIDTALDQSASGAIDHLHVRKPFAGRIKGSAGESAQVNFDNTYTTDHNFIWEAQGGEISLDASSATAVTSSLINGGGVVNLTNGVFTTITLVSGTLNIGENPTLVTVNVFGGVCNIGAKSDAFTLNVYGGSVYSERLPATAINVYGGTARVEATGTVTAVTQTGGTLYPYVGTVTTADLFGGAFNPADAPRAVTVTTANVWRAKIGQGPNVTYSTTNYNAGKQDSDLL